MAEQPTYLLTPNFTFKPYTGPIALGNIIADPFRPHRTLTAVSVDALAARYPRVEKATENERSVARVAAHDVAIAVWARFLKMIGTRLIGERAASVATDYKMDSLVTEYFVSDPDQSEIEARVTEPRVRAVMTSSGLEFAQPVYMVTGLKIAKGFKGKRESGRNVATTVQGGGAVPTPAGDVSIGASMSRGIEAEARDEWTAGGDIVFAYQLLKIELKGWKSKRLVVDEFRPKAAYLGLDDDDDDDDEDGEEDT
ncbi:hypothetical protein XA68_17161 [Ophiocordyceps unilateralis]|uniref:Uncharacterized protein n=1 Tax=Ophiocordyceps unilateralis TaxID=268505 RepID=A0A2A9PJU8_OPHUN|nr:hypothetical protein XA68_17161 [Ophiocordyceps unilateralis]